MECKIGLALFLIYTTKLYKHLNAGKLSSLSLHSYTPSHKTGLTYPKKCRLFAISRCMYKLYADLVRDLLTELGGTEMYVLDTHTHFGFYLIKGHRIGLTMSPKKNAIHSFKLAFFAPAPAFLHSVQWHST